MIYYYIIQIIFSKNDYQLNRHVLKKKFKNIENFLCLNNSKDKKSLKMLNILSYNENNNMKIWLKFHVFIVIYIFIKNTIRY